MHDSRQFHAATADTAQTSGNEVYGWRARAATWGKPRLKRVLVAGYCWGVLPLRFVGWAFRILHLEHE